MSPVPDPSQNHTGSPVDDLNCPHQLTAVGVQETSSEEEETSSLDINGYQLLPQGPENLEHEDIDYNSLSGLLSSLDTHGPNEISTEVDAASENTANSNITFECYGYDTTQIPVVTSQQQQQQLVLESKSKANRLYTEEQASLWRTEGSANDIDIDDDKENEIKSVMMKITLPSSAIPPWAKDLSEDEWKTHIKSRIFRNSAP